MLPVVAIVGRPNVGKSTLLNRLAKRRVSIVHDTPGVTRDRVGVEIELDGRAVEVVDTGGIGIVDRQDLHPDIHLQIDSAIASASVILFLVDSRDGLQPLDEEVADRLRRQDVPVILLANKSETRDAKNTVGEFYGLGLGDPQPISAEHGDGIDVLIERVHDLVDEVDRRDDPALKIAIVGRRNAGKSTFINALLDEERVIVSDVPGTTRDAVDVRFTKDGQEFIAIDTAGLLRRTKLKGDIEYYAQARSMSALRRADVAVLLIDAEAGISQIDKRIASEIEKLYRACVIGVNKWDLVRERGTTGIFSEYLSKALPGLHYAPCVFLTAKEGRNVVDTISLAQSLAKQSRKRVSTGEMNRAIEELQTSQVMRSRKGRMPKIYYGTQVSVSPPTLVLSVNKADHFSPAYRRTIENRFRERFDYQEIPIRVIYRQRKSLYHD